MILIRPSKKLNGATLLAFALVSVIVVGVIAVNLDMQPSEHVVVYLVAAAKSQGGSCELSYRNCLSDPRQADKQKCEDVWKTCVERKCVGREKGSLSSCPSDADCELSCTEMGNSTQGLVSCCAGGPKRNNSCRKKINGECIQKIQRHNPQDQQGSLSIDPEFLKAVPMDKNPPPLGSFASQLKPAPFELPNQSPFDRALTFNDSYLATLSNQTPKSPDFHMMLQSFNDYTLGSDGTFERAYGAQNVEPPTGGLTQAPPAYSSPAPETQSPESGGAIQMLPESYFRDRPSSESGGVTQAPPDSYFRPAPEPSEPSNPTTFRQMPESSRPEADAAPTQGIVQRTLNAISPGLGDRFVGRNIEIAKALNTWLFGRRR